MASSRIRHGRESAAASRKMVKTPFENEMGGGPKYKDFIKCRWLRRCHAAVIAILTAAFMRFL